MGNLCQNYLDLLRPRLGKAPVKHQHEFHCESDEMCMETRFGRVRLTHQPVDPERLGERRPLPEGSGPAGALVGDAPGRALSSGSSSSSSTTSAGAWQEECHLGFAPIIPHCWAPLWNAQP